MSVDSASQQASEPLIATEGGAPSDAALSMLHSQPGIGPSLDMIPDDALLQVRVRDKPWGCETVLDVLAFGTLY